MANSLVVASSDTSPSRLSSQAASRFTNWLPRLLMAGIVLLLVGLAGIVINAVNHLPNAAITVEPKGLNVLQFQNLKQRLGTNADHNLLQTNLQDYVDKLQAVDWVGQVDVRRDWQQGIVVTAVPRQAVAKFGSEQLVDANGVVFTPVDTADLHNSQLMQLQGDSQNAVVMMQQVKQVSDWFLPLGLKVQEVIVTPRMAWLFRFNNGLRVLVDNDNTSEKLYRLSIMLQNQLNTQINNLQTIDLRYKNGMAITKRPPQPLTEDNKPSKSNTTHSQANTKATHLTPTSH